MDNPKISQNRLSEAVSRLMDDGAGIVYMHYVLFDAYRSPYHLSGSFAFIGNICIVHFDTYLDDPAQ
ncbi:hypothetical protein OZX67_00010 [Bifidobacterium sp. ESL0728]|uniref:hypothetical protein n=1 Tax=Bifidobacterium sp. ESL0728 TaxID=2983220 RepID=UPI0023F77E29|nr:hypothetical protein [Bifidobacterium sp. ESL0728]WEV59012.1 hypothetical protein OZX67_00010 [Bifidobacterium sp. ESL0728]